MRYTAIALMGGGAAIILAGAVAATRDVPEPQFETVVPKTRLAAQVPRARDMQPGEVARLPVVSADGEEVGQVTRVSVDPDGAVREIRIETSRFMGLGTRTVRIPRAMFERKGNRIRLTLTAGMVERLPEVGDEVR